MSTNSRIAIEDQTGKVRSIYCHWDGYPSHHGPILLDHYNTQEKVESLIALGAISSLDENVEIPEGVEHNFKTPAYGIVVAYHRDRKEEKNLDIEYHASVKDFVNSDYGKYGYIFTTAGEWLFVNGRKTVLLDSVVVKEAE